MKITTFDSKGSIKEVREQHVQVPDYITSFDNDHSFLNISDQEIKVIESEENSLRKTITMEWITESILHDYNNYKEKYKVEVNNAEIETIFEKSRKDPLVCEGDSILSSILRVYGRITRVKVSGTNVDLYELLLGEVIVSEDFFAKISSDSKAFNFDYGYSVWLRILLYHAARTTIRNEHRHLNISIEETFYISLQNLINKYYYSLVHAERRCEKLPNSLSIQKEILGVFVTKSGIRSFRNYYHSHRFLIKLIHVLHNTDVHNRNNIYGLIQYLVCSRPLIENKTNGLLLFERVNSPKTISKSFQFRFSNYKNQTECEYIINENEIFSMRESVASPLYVELKPFLETMYKAYVSVYKEKWTNNVLTDAERYFYLQPQHRNDWISFYHHEVGRIREESRMHPDSFEAQQCFFYLLCDFIHPTDDLVFTRGIIANLLLILIKNQCESQEGLYECMFKMNYIKEKLPIRDAKDIAVTCAMEYIECLFVKGCKLVPPLYQGHIQPLFMRLFENENVRSNIINVEPNGFSGGFNLKLVYNLIGLLKDYNFVIAGAQKVDKEINEYNTEKGIIKKPIERKSYISEFKNDSEISNYINELRVIVSKYLQGIK